MAQYLYSLIIYIDHSFFFLINKTLSNPLFDFMMPLFDDPEYFIAIVLLLWIYLIIKDSKNRWRLIILIPLTIIISDQIGYHIKKLKLRDRPWHAMKEEINLLVKKNTGQHYSFPSNHALNSMALANIFSSIYYRKKILRMYLFGFSLLIMLSRIYIGVHYPIDVISGALIGFIVSFILIKTYNRFRPNLEEHQ